MTASAGRRTLAPVLTPVRLAVVTVAALSSSGCAFQLTHRCAVPPPVVEAAPGRGKLPLAVAVRVVPRTPTETFEQRDEHHRWGVDPVPPTRILVDRLAASVFEQVIADPEGAGSAAAPIDAFLEVQVEEVRFAWQPIGAGPYSARVAYRVALRTPGGATVTEFPIHGEGARGAVYDAFTHCTGIGDAVALAMQSAGANLLARLGSDPAFGAWLAARGIAATVLAARPPESYPAPAAPAPVPPADAPYVPPGMELPGGPASGAATAAAAPRPVTAPPATPPVPRSVQLRVAVGVFHHGDETAGALEHSKDGFAYTLLGAEWRPRPAVGVTLEVGGFARDYSGKVLTAPSPLAVPRGIFLGTMLFGVGVRGVLPGGPVEPWIGATALALRNELSATYSLFGISGSGAPEETAWSAGLDLGAGLLLYPGKGVQLGIEVRRILSRATFSALPGAVSIGGWTTSLSFGGAGP